MREDGMVALLGGGILELSKGADIEVVDATAALTDEVVVRDGVAVEAIEGAAVLQLPYLVLFNQDIQVSVDRSQAQVGKVLPKGVENFLSSGVSFGMFEQLKDTGSLFAVAVNFSFVHKTPNRNDY